MLMQQELVLTEMQELRRANKLECWQCNKTLHAWCLKCSTRGKLHIPLPSEEAPLSWQLKPLSHTACQWETCHSFGQLLPFFQFRSCQFYSNTGRPSICPSPLTRAKCSICGGCGCSVLVIVGCWLLILFLHVFATFIFAYFGIPS